MTCQGYMMLIYISSSITSLILCLHILYELTCLVSWLLGMYLDAAFCSEPSAKHK
jgi:hypothetical protein